MTSSSVDPLTKEDKERALRVLGEIEKLIEDPAHWTTGAYARNEKGDPIASDDPSAVCWCLIGAKNKVRAESRFGPPTNYWVMRGLFEGAGSALLMVFNDEHNHEDVMRCIRDAKRYVKEGS